MNTIYVCLNWEASVELTITQLEHLKSAVNNKTGTTLRITKKNFQDEELPHELFLTARQKTKVRNTFASNMSMDVKLSKAQLPKIIQSGGFLGVLLCKLAGSLMKVGVLLAKNILGPLATIASTSAIDGAIQRKMRGWDVVRTG